MFLCTIFYDVIHLPDDDTIPGQDQDPRYADPDGECILTYQNVGAVGGGGGWGQGEVGGALGVQPGGGEQDGDGGQEGRQPRLLLQLSGARAQQALK